MNCILFRLAKTAQSLFFSVDIKILHGKPIGFMHRNNKTFIANEYLDSESYNKCEEKMVE